MNRFLRAASAACLALLWAAPPAAAHPHVFVDARIAFIVGKGGALEALDITWRFDPFETLYALSTEGVTPQPDGTLDEEGQRRMVKANVEWHPNFDGFAKLSLQGAPVALAPPSGVTARLVDGQLEIGFRRDLPRPEALAESEAEVAVYEATYFYAVTVAEPPKVLGEAADCAADLVPFDPDTQHINLQKSLFELGREETPATQGIGALLADRIVLSCE